MGLNNQILSLSLAVALADTTAAFSCTYEKQVLQMINPVRHRGVYLSVKSPLVTLSAVLSSDGIITIYSTYIPGYSL